MKELLQYELTSISFFLTKDRYLRKSDKEDLASKLRKLLNNMMPEHLPSTDDKRMAIVDFMGSARKVLIKKLKLKTFSDLSSFLWSSFKEFA